MTGSARLDEAFARGQVWELNRISALFIGLLWCYFAFEWSLPHQFQLLDGRRYPSAGFWFCIGAIIGGAVIARLAAGTEPKSKPSD